MLSRLFRTKNTSLGALRTLIDQLAVMKRRVDHPYFVPGLWVDFKSPEAVMVDPFQFYRERFLHILSTPSSPLIEGKGGEWTREALVYNLFPRLTTAFDHDDDGGLQVNVNSDGWREPGTLLKCIAILPFIRDMGFNTVHLLPITAIGQDGKKGNLGSPYAIRNPYQLDPNLAEPALNLSAEQLFAAFVEAAHHLGMRVVMEFVLRTASKDSNWIGEHPEWFYWIHADIRDRTHHMGRTDLLRSFGQPIYSNETLGLIHWKVGQGDHHDLPAPYPFYKEMFTAPPRPERVKLENGRYVGTLEDGTRVRIPGAFADWPPQDSQPPWSDVTYLRLYDHPDFNYMAYNTLRMYDSRLAQPENRVNPLWDAIAGVIPHYQREFDIDGVLLDMGHALPMELKQRIVTSAREVNPDFAFWDENFSISGSSRAEGYNAVVGYWLLGLHEGHSVRNFINEMGRNPHPISFLAASENHNTPRAFARYGGIAYAHYALALSVMVPGVVFVLTGFELGESKPINTGLGFSYEQQAQHPSDQLPLFSVARFAWTRPSNYVKSVRQALLIRQKYAALLSDNDPSTFYMGYSDNPAILVFTRRKGDQAVSVIANTDMTNAQNGRVVMYSRQRRVPGLWGVIDEQGMNLSDEVAAQVSLLPGYVLIIDNGNPDKSYQP